MPNVGDADNKTGAPVKHYPHEDTPRYARELMTEVRAAEIRLQNLIDEHDPSITVTATTAIPMDELLRVKATSTAEALFHAPLAISTASCFSFICASVISLPMAQPFTSSTPSEATSAIS